MSVTDVDLQNLVITTLADADPSATAGLTTNVPKYWSLWARQGVMPELRYWYVRREAIRYLQACLTQQIDYMRKNTDSTRVMTESSRLDMAMSASASETAASTSDRSANSAYSSTTSSAGSGSSSMNRSASQNRSGSSSLSDTGHGTNVSSSGSSLTSSSTVNAASCDATASNRNQTREVSGSVVHINASKKWSIGFDPGIGGSITETGTYESYDPENNVIVETHTGLGNSMFTARETDVRANSMTQLSNQNSASGFNANRVTAETMSESGVSAMSSVSASTYSLTGSGSGAMTSTGAGNSHMVGASSRVETSSGEAHRVSHTVTTITLDLKKLHQRFLHLQDLWQKANEMIKWYEKQRLSLPAYALQVITIQFPAGLNAEAANQFLIKDPFGTIPARPSH